MKSPRWRLPWACAGWGSRLRNQRVKKIRVAPGYALGEEGKTLERLPTRSGTVLKRIAKNPKRRRLRAPPFESMYRLALEAESAILPELELAFANKSLRQLCESAAKANRHLGVRVAEKLRRRLSDLRAATSVKDLIAGRLRGLEGARHRLLVVDLSEGSRIVFRSNHSVVPVLKSGDVDWSKVRRVKILRIESDDHDKE